MERPGAKERRDERSDREADTEGCGNRTGTSDLRKRDIHTHTHTHTEAERGNEA